MFGTKTNDYKKITFVTYPGGNVIHTTKYSYDFDKGEKEEEKYLKESEKFKIMSLKAQSDISENRTLSDDTLKITVEVAGYTYTFISAAGFINVKFAKLLASMSDAKLTELSEKFLNRGESDFPRLYAFMDMINEVAGPEFAIPVAFKAHIRIHNSYTPEHVSAIKYIVSHLNSEFEDNGNELVVASDDMELKNAITDLGMSTYFDIDIEE